MEASPASNSPDHPQQSAAAEPSQEEQAFFVALYRACPQPWVTTAVVTLNVLVFGAMAVTGVNLVAPASDALLKWGADFGVRTAGGDEWWRLVTSAFVHIGLLHLAINMGCFWDTGRLVERFFGSWAFAVLYLLSAVGGSLVSLAWHPKTVSAGASGAVFGVYGALLAYLLVSPKGAIPPRIFRDLRTSTLTFLCYNLLSTRAAAHIDIAAHLGGLLTGGVSGLVLLRRLTPEVSSSPWRLARAAAWTALFFLLAWAVGQDVKEAPLVQAELKYSKRDYRGAIADYSEVIQRDPKDQDAYFKRGFSRSHAGDPDGAIADYTRALELNPKDAAAYFNRGLLRSHQGDLDGAIADYTRALEWAPRKWRAYFNRALAYEKQGNVDSAIADYTRALEWEPKDAAAYFNRGLLRGKKGDQDGASADISRAIELDPTLRSP